MCRQFQRIAVWLLLIASGPLTTVAEKPLTEQALIGAFGFFDEAEIMAKIEQDRIYFEANDTVLKRLQDAGATSSLIEAVKKLLQTRQKVECSRFA